MFKIKEYDLGDQCERIGYYPEVVQDIQESKKQFKTGIKKGYEYVMTREQKDAMNKDRSIQRAKTKIRRITQRYNMRYMWTLTFSKKYLQTFNSVNQNVSNYDTGNVDDVWRLWKSFLKRCKDYGLEFNYIVTLEVQEKRLKETGEKVFHFHFITDKRIPVNRDQAKKSGKKYSMSELWTHGFSFVTFKKSKKKLAHLYVIKYLTKLVDEIGKGQNRYRIKRGLVIPVSEFFVNEFDSFFTTIESEKMAKNSYAVLGDKLEIFWCIYDKSG